MYSLFGCKHVEASWLDLGFSEHQSQGLDDEGAQPGEQDQQAEIGPGTGPTSRNRTRNRTKKQKWGKEKDTKELNMRKD